MREDIFAWCLSFSQIFCGLHSISLSLSLSRMYEPRLNFNAFGICVWCLITPVVKVILKIQKAIYYFFVDSSDFFFIFKTFNFRIYKGSARSSCRLVQLLATYTFRGHRESPMIVVKLCWFWPQKQHSFTIYDASDYPVGAILGQEKDKKNATVN